ncbi:hypothetical protein VNO77_50205 [Canavalia gladiata]
MVVEALLLEGVLESDSSFTVFRRLGIRNSQTPFGFPMESLSAHFVQKPFLMVRQSSPLESQLPMRRFLIREVRTLNYGYSGFNSSIELLKSIHILKESKERDEGRSSRKEETLTTNPGRVKQGTIANESRVNLSAEVLIQSEHGCDATGFLSTGVGGRLWNRGHEQLIREQGMRRHHNRQSLDTKELIRFKS